MARKSSSESSADANPVAEFETSLDALEALVARMEGGQLTLEESLASYETGVGLYRKCQAALEQAELRVKLLTDLDNPASARDFPGLTDPTSE
ncbi:exodeoxyribonuclease VII small subunit [Lysobacter sp. HDW10]|uniref:exodeoxyribonuclease VII small subunit n=1 Tax=Lysobacter sp. HDW10 TaxID=2714936 RepID=UPI00140D2266|nr:exodeoxyribonuclease VII small subunit [Lysobacter sp. HDW10]QIK80188.1 exodeoxyribonuclease VII small subunit [Lysobacter sp. HDW10]